MRLTNCCFPKASQTYHDVTLFMERLLNFSFSDRVPGTASAEKQK